MAATARTELVELAETLEQHAELVGLQLQLLRYVLDSKDSRSRQSPGDRCPAGGGPETPFSGG